MIARLTDAFIADGTNVGYRAYHALAGSGRPVEPAAVARLARHMIGNHAAGAGLLTNRVIVAFDGAHGGVRRKAIYPEYKAHRAGCPEELTIAFGLLRADLRTAGARVAWVEGEEADDVIATYAHLLLDRGLTATILSSDRDLLQLVGDGVTVLLPVRSIRDVRTFTPAEFRAQYGFAPPILADYKALCGDVSDNIDGVPGIGEKSARYLCQTYGPLDNVFSWVRSGGLAMNARVTKALRAHEEVARRNLALTTLRRDVPGIELRPVAATA